MLGCVAENQVLDKNQRLSSEIRKSGFPNSSGRFSKTSTTGWTWTTAARSPGRSSTCSTGEQAGRRWPTRSGRWGRRTSEENFRSKTFFQVVEQNFPLHNNELTLDGFLTLHQMEAEDNQGDPRELRVTVQVCKLQFRLLSQLFLSCSIFRQWVTIGL